MILLAQEKLNFAKREKIPDPTLSVTGQRYNQASQIVSEVAVGISINIPWLNRKKYHAEEEEAVNNIEAARHAAAAARAEAMVMLRVQLQKVETARHHVALYQSELIPTAKHTVEDIRSAYETDKKSFVDLLTAQQSLREFQTMLQKHLSDQATETVELEAVVGADRLQFSSESTPIKKSRK
jgi:outer membrane protein TolC